MNELPKRIMAWGHFGDDSVTGQWSSNTYHNDNVVEYVRADLVAELVNALMEIANDESCGWSDQRITACWALNEFRHPTCE